jgi:pimeloyl-ACP methyl ester carboxylesterase
MVTETDIKLSDGRTLHAYDTAPGSAGGPGDSLPVFWHHGTPNTGEPPEPLFEAATRLGVRWVSYDRPGYGGSTPNPGRDVASAAADTASVADALGIGQFAVMGHSGGGPHALACAALLSRPGLPGRVVAVVSGSSPAPFDAEGLDWFAGLHPGGEQEHLAAVKGRAALAEYLAAAEWDPEIFIPADHAALQGEWTWLNRVVGKALEGGLDAMVDDDLAYVAPWGFEVSEITIPVLFLHGGQDRMVPAAHSQWLAKHVPSSELWLRPEDGHLSVLAATPAALAWLTPHFPATT